MLARRYARPLIAYALAHLLALPSPAIAESMPAAMLTPAATAAAAPTPLSSASATPAELTPTPITTPMATPFAMLQPPKEPKRPFTLSRLGYGAVAAGENVVYVPAKLAYAGIGVFVGAASWVVAGGKPKLAKRVWKMALGGDYMITPSMVEGTEPVEFSGTVETEPIVGRSSYQNELPEPTPIPGAQHRPWWHLWGRKNANATPTPEPSPTPTAGAANAPSGTKPRHWWQFWRHKAAQVASPIPSPTPGATP
jgi:hypothetical protein